MGNLGLEAIFEENKRRKFDIYMDIIRHDSVSYINGNDDIKTLEKQIKGLYFAIGEQRDSMCLIQM